ncbi:MAG TPA: hypothetical protein VM823_06160 [Gaiellales bacterium]|nr:hypothetical protein [Gaiellales bacterium]
MTVDERPEGNGAAPAEAEMSLLVDVGSAWTKAAAVARSRGRWRIVSHVAQPSGWGEDELRAALAADRLSYASAAGAHRAGGRLF